MVTYDWLKIRNAEIRPGSNGHSWLLYQGGKFIYGIVSLPAEGKNTNKIMESNNGHQVQKGNIYDSLQASLEGGLNELREHLGW